MDSGTKNKWLLRLLSVLLLAVLLVSVSSLAVFADGEEGPPAEDSSSVEASDVSQGEAANEYVSVFPSGYPNVSQDATLGDLLMYGLQVAGIGLLVVFLVLVIIMAILYIFKLVAVSKKPAPKAEAAPKAAPAAKASPAPGSSGSEEETIVAIATAAIAASRGATECAFKVISVTKIQ